MKILLIGDTVNFEEAKLKFGEHDYQFVQSHTEAGQYLSEHEVIFDFKTSEAQEHLHMYTDSQVPIFFNAVTISLAKLFSGKNFKRGKIFGFNGMPTLLNRSLFEVSLLDGTGKSDLEQVCEKLKVKASIVDDRVGLVTPRIICMIVNEAFYTVQEGTATREDIDMAMKLGTNYPFGPFEWCDKIGIKNVYALLKSVYDDTADERYKICPLLKKEYLRRA